MNSQYQRLRPSTYFANLDTSDIKVIYKPCFEMGEQLPWYGCKVLLRIRGEQHQPVVNATVTSDGKSPGRVDSVGRWITWLHMDESVNLLIAAPGFVPVERRLTCDSTSESKRAVTVLLSK